MNVRKLVIYVSLLFLSQNSLAQTVESDKDTTKKGKVSQVNISFAMTADFAVGYTHLNNSFVDNGTDLSGNLIFKSTKEKKQYLKFGIGWDYQFLTINSNKLLFANKDSIWMKDSNTQLKTNSLNLFYLNLPIIYRNDIVPNLSFEVGMNNKFLLVQENLFRQNTPYTTVMTENFYQNTKFNKYQADIFLRVKLYKNIFVEAKQSLTKIADYSNFNSRPYSISVGIRF